MGHYILTFYDEMEYNITTSRRWLVDVIIEQLKRGAVLVDIRERK